MELFNDELYKIKLDEYSDYEIHSNATKMSMTEAKKYFQSLLAAI